MKSNYVKKTNAGHFKKLMPVKTQFISQGYIQYVWVDPNRVFTGIKSEMRGHVLQQIISERNLSQSLLLLHALSTLK